MKKRIHEEIETVARGGSFAEFERRTRADWRRLAEHLLARADVPLAVAVEDVIQQLLLVAWTSLPKADSKRGKVGEFVVYVAIARTKRWLHQQRRAKRRKGPSRYDFSLSAISNDEREERRFEVSDEPNQEQLAEQRLATGRLLGGCRSAGERECLSMVFRTGDIELAARALYSDVDARRRLRLDSGPDAKREIKRAIKRAKERTECRL